MNILQKPAHRPSRRFPDAPRKILQPEVLKCPYCDHKLKSTGNLNINREVQTMNGPLNVRAYSWRCVSDDCPRTHIRYRARRELWRISLPKAGLRLDVIAHIGWQRDKMFRQFCEIQLDLQSRGIQISQRHVGRLYRQYLSLLGGMTDLRLNELKKVNLSHGGIVLALDGLQPDKDGTTLYVLYEAISETTIAAAWIDKRDTEHLTNWLKPYSELDLTVLATLSLGYDAEIATLKSLWKNSPHQMCLTHFLGDCGKPIKEADKKLKTALRQGMGQLPPVPGDKNSALAGPAAATPVLSEPTTVHHTLNTPHPISDHNVATHDNTSNNHHTNPNPVLPTQESQEPDSLAKPAKQQTNNTNLPTALGSEPSNTRQTKDKSTAMPPASPNTRQTSKKAAFGDHEISRGLPTSSKTLEKADNDTLNYEQKPQECLDTKFECQESFARQTPIPCANAHYEGQSPKTCANVLHNANLASKNQATSLQSDLVPVLNTTDLIAQGKTTSHLSKFSSPPISTQDANSTPVSTQDTNSTPISTQDTNSTPISTQDTNSTPISTQDTNSIPISTQDTNLTPISTQDTTSTPISTQDTTSTPISTQDTTSTPVSNQNTTSSPVSNQNTASTTNQTPPVAEHLIDQKQLRMREIEHLFRKSFQQTLNHPSRYPSFFGGWLGYQQLSGIMQAMDEHLPGLGESYLHRLYTCGQQALNQATELAHSVGESIDLLTELISILFEPFSDLSKDSNKKSSADVKKEVEAFIESSKQGDELAQSFISQTKRLIDKWKDSLFNCYDVPALPPNNAALESRFNLLRNGQRRIHGRKKTSQLRRTAHLQLLLNASSVSELLEQLYQVRQDEYFKARVSLEAAEERQRQLARLRRKPYQTASALVVEYLELLNEDVD